MWIARFIFLLLVCGVSVLALRFDASGPRMSQTGASELGNGKFRVCNVIASKSSTYGMTCERPFAVDHGGYIATVNYSSAENHPSLFGQLRLHTSSKFGDLLQMKAAGFAEGYVTAEKIYDHWLNTKWWIDTHAKNVSKLFEWFEQHDMWMERQLARVSDPIWLGKQGKETVLFWQGVQLVMAQFEGVVAGYNVKAAELAASSKAAAAAGRVGVRSDLTQLSRMALIIINSMGDMDDVLPMLFPPDYSSMSAPQLRTHLGSSGHCSALVKVNGDLSDLLMGHVTWWTYTSTSRIYKHWDLNLKHPALATGRISCSSYPGQISSMDDFYILGSKLVVLETSNEVFSRELYGRATPLAALSWQRMRVAHLWAEDGPSWVRWLSLHNSGTYNNQYIVVDLNRFKPGGELQRGLLTIAEQIPGDVVWGDATQELERGHWPSYNVPYFREVYDRSGYPEFLAAQSARGSHYADAVSGLRYQLAPRAKMFRRDAGGVGDLQGLKEILRYNNYTQDSYSGGSPWHTICSRGDLDTERPDADGCNDGKVTSYRLAVEMAAEAINSPPFGDGLPPFKWSGKWENFSHAGLPEVYSAAWEVQRP